MKSFHMSPEEFRRRGHQMVDWIADYRERIESYPVLSRVEPGELRRQLPEEAPSTGESFDAIFEDLDRLILPGITHWQSPSFYAYFRPTPPSPRFWATSSRPGSASRA